MGDWLKDIRWALNMLRVRRIARTLMFSQRERFFHELRPLVGRNTRIPWPDGMLYVDVNDVIRAHASTLTRSTIKNETHHD